jgi:hypothetical protein
VIGFVLKARTRGAANGPAPCRRRARGLSFESSSRAGLVPRSRHRCRSTPVRYQIASAEESGTVRAAGAAGAESSRRFLPYVAMVKATDTRQSDNFRAG